MKLLSKTDARDQRKRDNDSLVDSNIRLRKMENEVLSRLNNAKADYAPDKVAALEEFNSFLKDIQEKKAKLLKELSAIQSLVNDEKEIYYGLVAKQDVLEERAHAVRESEDKLNIREAFINQLEQKMYV